jgi:hypothetical protein
VQLYHVASRLDQRVELALLRLRGKKEKKEKSFLPNVSPTHTHTHTHAPEEARRARLRTALSTRRAGGALAEAVSRGKAGRLTRHSAPLKQKKEDKKKEKKSGQ